MRAFTVALCACLALTTTIWGSPARADRVSPTAAELDRASELFKKAKPLHASGKLAEAHDLYAQAWALHASPDIAANLAAVELALGKKRDAAEHFQFALQRLLAGTTAEQKAKLSAGFEKARKDVATLRVTLQPEGAELSVDGAPVGKAPFDGDLFLEPGERRLSASRVGFVGRSETLVATKGETLSVVIELQAEKKVLPGNGLASNEGQTDPPPEPVRDQPKPTEPSGAPAYVALGLGIAGLGAGVGFLVAAASKDSQREDRFAEIPGTNECGSGTTAVEACEEISSLADDAKRFRTFGYVGFGVAAAGAAATFLLWPRASRSGGAVIVTPDVGEHSAAVRLHGRF